MQYTIRKATLTDIDLLDLIHTENMKGYVEKNYPWNPQLFHDQFIPDEYQVIEIDNIQRFASKYGTIKYCQNRS